MVNIECGWLQEARETGDRLRRSHESLAWGLNTPAAASLTALLDTKDARIMSLEREVGLLESEVNRMRESAASSTASAVAGAVTTSGTGGGSLSGSRWGSRASLVTPPPPSTDDSRFLQVVQEREKKAKLQVSDAINYSNTPLIFVGSPALKILVT